MPQRAGKVMAYYARFATAGTRHAIDVVSPNSISQLYCFIRRITLISLRPSLQLLWDWHGIASVTQTRATCVIDRVVTATMDFQHWYFGSTRVAWTFKILVKCARDRCEGRNSSRHFRTAGELFYQYHPRSAFQKQRPGSER